jgi:hypothetical protein
MFTQIRGDTNSKHTRTHTKMGGGGGITSYSGWKHIKLCPQMKNVCPELGPSISQSIRKVKFVFMFPESYWLVLLQLQRYAHLMVTVNAWESDRCERK